MNLPSSLALSQSKFFQSRLGILLLGSVGLAIAGGIVLLRQKEPPAPVLPDARQPRPRRRLCARDNAQAPEVTARPLRSGRRPTSNTVLRLRRVHDSVTAPAPGAATSAAPATLCARRDAGPSAVAPSASLRPRSRRPPLPAAAVPTADPRSGGGDRSAHGRDPEVGGTPACSSRAERYEYIGADAAIRSSRFSTADSDPIRRTVPWLTWGTSTWWHHVGSSDKFGAGGRQPRTRIRSSRRRPSFERGTSRGSARASCSVQSAFGESQTLSIRLQPKKGARMRLETSFARMGRPGAASAALTAAISAEPRHRRWATSRASR